MFQRLAICFGLLTLLLGCLNVPLQAQTIPPLPNCLAWTPVPRLRPSPLVIQDNVLLSVGGYPIESNLTYGVLRSPNRGLTWQQFSSPGNGDVWFSSNFSIDHTLAITPWPLAQAHISDNDGVSWRTVIFPRSDANVFALGDAQHLYLGYGREVGQPVPMELLASADGGQTWQRTYAGMEVRDIVISPAFVQDHTVLMVLGLYQYSGGIRKSADAGATWERADTGIHGGLGIYSLTFSPAYASDRTLFCVNDPYYEEMIYKSTDAGASWQPLANPHLYPSAPPELLISPRYAHDQTLWMVNYYRAIVSHDGGQTWQTTPHPIWLQAAAEYCRPTGECGVEIFGATLQKGASIEEDTYYMYRSYDYGETWQCLEDPTLPQEPTPTRPPPVEIPEPATGLLLVGGLAALAGYARRRVARPA